MKKLFKNFTWSAFFAYGIVFTLVGIPIAWFFGEFKEPDFTIEKFIARLLIKGVVFGFVMSLLIGNPILNKRKKENED